MSMHWLASFNWLTRGLRDAGQLPPFFGKFYGFFVFWDFKKVVVCWCVRAWVLFYLVSQSGEPTIGEGEACETKS